jgi:hypothetical protein
MQTPMGRRDTAPSHSLPQQYIGGVVSITPRPRFTSCERPYGTYWIGVCLDSETGGKTLCLCIGSNPDRPVYSQTLY